MVVLGRIVAPFGVRGWLKIRPFGDDPEAWRAMPELWLSRDDVASAENWKPYARQSATTAAELGPRIALHDELEAIRYACPSCARLHWVEIKLKTEQPLHDMELTF